MFSLKNYSSISKNEREEEIELTGKLTFLENGFKGSNGQADGSKEWADEIQGNGLSLSKISKEEIDEMRRRSRLYIEWKCAEDEATPSSKVKLMRTRYLSKALNAQRLEEFLVNNFPAPLKNITIIGQQKR